MKIVLADYILTMDKENRVIRKGAAVFDKKIIEVSGDLEELQRKYSDFELIDGGENSVLMPGLVNTHIHLEFSNNATDLEYGSFMGWLYSVMEKREELIESCSKECYDKTVKSMLRSGTTAFGAVSSYGFDMQSCVDAPQKVVFYNEVIGSNPAMVDGALADFTSRLEKSLAHRSDRFFPGVAVHSPHAVHPILAKKVLGTARDRGLPVTAHFMESRAERRWLDADTGEFKPFFQQYLKTETAVVRPKEFLELFEGVRTLFTHCVQATGEELDMIDRLGAGIIHCPVSNRLLGVGLLGLEEVKNREIPYTLGTDGLSSNYSVNLFKELRAALLMHADLDLHLLARDLLRSVTVAASEALGINAGKIAPNRDADLILFKVPGGVETDGHLPMQVILHTSEVDEVFIDGERQ